MTRLEVYFDYGSPYSYLGWQRITNVHPERYAEHEVLWKPVSAAHIFRADGNRPRSEMPNQRKYLYADVARWAEAYGVPFAPPPDNDPAAMPVRSIEAGRMHFVADQMGSDTEEAWMDAVFRAYFRDGRDISDLAVLEGLAREVGIQDDVQEAVGRGSVKKLLVANTNEAYQHGAPGVPYTVLDGGDGYWGNDRLEWVEAVLSGRVPGDV